MDSHPHRASRRSFLQGLALGAAATALPGRAFAATPVTRPHGARFKLSLAAYSFNRVLPRRGDAKAQAKATMQLTDFIDFCAKMQLDACELTSYYFPDDVTTDYLMQVKQQTFRLGLDISGTAIGNDFCLKPGPDRDRELAQTREWIDHAATMGAPVIRIFAGKVPPGDDEASAIARCIEGINQSLEYAAAKGVYLGLENHGGITATPAQMLRIVEGVTPSPWFGVNFDSGNFRTADPYADLAQIAPYAVNAQIKVSMHRDDRAERADFKRILDLLRAVDYRGYIVLEYEEDEDPFEAIPALLDELRGLIG
jgi:sugar phosphate isomerase/epimerase